MPISVQQKRKIKIPVKMKKLLYLFLIAIIFILSTIVGYGQSVDSLPIAVNVKDIPYTLEVRDTNSARERYLHADSAWLSADSNYIVFSYTINEALIDNKKVIIDITRDDFSIGEYEIFLKYGYEYIGKSKTFYINGIEYKTDQFYYCFKIKN